MKTHDLKGLDEQDAFVLRDKLKLHCANLRGMIHTSSGELLNAPSDDADGVIADIRNLEAHASILEAKIGRAAPAFQFSTSSAARFVVCPGSSAGRLSSPASAEKSSTTPAKQSLTEKVLAARGVTTLAELAKRREQNLIRDED